MVKYDLSLAHPTMFKRRKKLNNKETKLKFGDYGLFFSHQGRFEIKYIFILRKIFKKWLNNIFTFYLINIFIKMNN